MTELTVSAEWPENVIIYTDGASRGNPGPASLGIYVIDECGQVVEEVAEPLGEQTNNYAEYMAVVRALEKAVDKKCTHVHLKADSQLLVRQMCGQYKVKAEGLKPLFLKAKKFESQLTKVIYEHVRREMNKEADRLANHALDYL